MLMILVIRFNFGLHMIQHWWQFRSHLLITTITTPTTHLRLQEPNVIPEQIDQFGPAQPHPSIIEDLVPSNVIVLELLV